MREEVIDDLITRYIPEKAFPEQWETAGLHEEVLRIFGLNLPIADWAKEEGIADEAIRERVTDAVERKMAEKAARIGPEVMRVAEKTLLLQVLDQSWKEHLLALDHLRHGIQLRAYGQRDPLNEYKREAFDMFEAMMTRLQRADHRSCSRTSRSGSRSRCKPVRGSNRRRRCRRASRRSACRRRWRAATALPMPAIPRPGRTSAATRSAPAGRARSSSTATASSADAAPRPHNRFGLLNPQ